MTLTRIRTVAFVFLVASTLGRPALAQTGDLDPRIANLVGSVSEERLSNILRKMQVPTRVAAATVAAQSGLLEDPGTNSTDTSPGLR